MNSTDHILAGKVISFWFEECTPQQWFTKNDEFDRHLSDRFGELVEQGLQGQRDSWAGEADTRLALILVLDQFTRNIHRKTPRAFAGDEMALGLTMRALAEGQLDDEAELSRRQFLLMPMMHSEDIGIQDQSLPLFEKYTSEMTLDYAVRHRDIIARFGRFPHRNQILGRPSTDDEKLFLTEPNSSF